MIIKKLFNQKLGAQKKLKHLSYNLLLDQKKSDQILFKIMMILISLKIMNSKVFIFFLTKNF